MNNLLDNAVKYTDKKGKIFVGLYPENDLLKICVSDTGIGISKEQKNCIFSPYHQLSHKKRNIQGLGMGLHITNKIIKQLAGKITVDSKLGAGSDFCVFLRKYEKKADDVITTDFEIENPLHTVVIADEELRINEFDSEKKTIFIVEDHLQLVANLKKELEEVYNIYFCVNGKEALEKMNTLPQPDIIISDIMMDVMDGYEFREKLIKKEEYKAIPFIYLTAKGSRKEKLKGLTQGAIDFISKPFVLDELKEKIKNWLLLIELKKFREDIELKAKHQKRLDFFIDEYNINPREKEVLNYLLQGYKNFKIADKMYISRNTVKKHIERIKNKVDVETKEDLLKCLYDYVYK